MEDWPRGWITENVNNHEDTTDDSTTLVEGRFTSLYEYQRELIKQLMKDTGYDPSGCGKEYSPSEEDARFHITVSAIRWLLTGVKSKVTWDRYTVTVPDNLRIRDRISDFTDEPLPFNFVNLFKGELYIMADVNQHTPAGHEGD